jgi:hypothetical protein
VRFIAVAACAAMLVAPAFAAAAPGDVNADAYYRKGKALMARGPLALLSGDVGTMKAQLMDATQRVRAENLAAKARGAPLYCPPAQGKIGASFVIDGLGAIPEARRKRMTLVDGWRDILVRTYPCR